MKTHGSVPSCATYRLDRDVLYEDPCGGLGVQHEATRVAEDSIPTGDKPTIYDFNPRSQYVIEAWGLVRR